MKRNNYHTTITNHVGPLLAVLHAFTMIGPATAGVTRTIAGQYTPGSGAVRIALTAVANASGPVTVTEPMPANVTAVNDRVSAGSSGIAGNTVIWTVDLSAGAIETLTYDAVVTATVCNEILTLLGTYTEGVEVFPIGGDSQMTQASDGWQNAPIRWDGSLDIPSGLHPAAWVDYYACNGSYVLHAAGVGIWGSADEFHFLHVCVMGDFTLSATVDMLEPNTSDWAKAGLMLRAGLDAGSPHVFVCTTNGGPAEPYRGDADIAFQYRDVQSAACTYDGFATNNDEVYFILRRTGNTVSVDYDNVEGNVAMPWKTCRPPNIDPAQPNLIGLALTSHSRGQIAQARFWNVSIDAPLLPPTAEVTRTIAGRYTAGQDFDVVLTADAVLDGGPATVIENVPPALPITNAVASTGTASHAGGTLKWNMTLAAGTSATLTYTVTPPAAACGDIWVVDGAFGMGCTPYAIHGDTQITPAGEGWDNSAILWTGDTDIPASLQPHGRTDWLACDDLYILWGAGSDIWDTADQFHFLYMPVLGDFHISAMVDIPPPARSAWSKAGLMLRASLDPGSPNILVAVTNGGPGLPAVGNRDIMFQWRDSQSSGTAWSLPVSAAMNNDEAYLVLRRAGSIVSSDYDDLEGTQVIGWNTRDTPGDTDIDPTQLNLLGLCLTSHAPGQLATARFTCVGVIVDPHWPPREPSGLTARGLGPDGILLNWQDNANNEDGFRVERKEDLGGAYAEIGRVGENVTFYADMGLIPGTLYFYRVRAFNPFGESAYSNEAGAEVGTCCRANRWYLYR